MDDRRHGIFIEEMPTPPTSPTPLVSGVQVAVGIAPINMGNMEDPLAPQVVERYADAVTKFGMTGDLMKFPLCQVIKAAFLIYNVAPVILINVMDPSKHVTAQSAEAFALTGQSLTIPHEGILLDTVVITDADAAVTYQLETDYSLGFTETGALTVSALPDGAITPNESLQIGYSYLDPDKVTEDDVVAGVKRIRDIQPLYDIVPEQITCPGWGYIDSQVYEEMLKQTRWLNRCFSSFVWADIDTESATDYEAAVEQKKNNTTIGISSSTIWPSEKGLLGENSANLWPCLTIGSEVYYYSAVAPSLMSYTDKANGDVPFVSPSNKKIQSPTDRNMKVTGACLKDGTPVIVHPEDADILNRNGICTVLRMQGWKFWGNRTAAYPLTKDVKDVFIATRRMFNWWGNSFILNYFEKVDDPMNRRLIESVIDSENIRANGFKGQQQIAGASISIDPDMTTEDILDGIIGFVQSLAFYTPAETMRNKLQFDPYALADAVLGQEG